MDAEVPSSTDFVLATRMRYELQQRVRVDEAEPQPAGATERGEDKDMRAAGFLMATRAMHEVNTRTLGRQRRRPEIPHEE